ncbi:uncharacterized protein UDID_00685 [Ustilago sp. UG-2017a]|nr:uncharacterized protein UDID_00685 [Ustilago sp. UG-2017a]
MIFDGIDIDLHFVFEGKLDSPNVSHIFNNYRHAALQHRPGNHTVVGAFLLSELERRLPAYQSDPQGQNVIVVRALREGSPGQNAEIHFESRPTMMPSGKQFEWVDAGLIYEFPPWDISVTVKRPSIQQTLTAIFKNVRSHSFVFQSPGVPIFSPVLDAAFNPRQVIAGGDDERRLNQFIQAFIDKTRLYNIPGQASSFNAQPPLPNSSSDAPPCSQNTFVTLSQGTAAQRDDIIRRNFNASSPAPTVAPGQDQPNSAEENVNVSSASSTTSKDTPPLRSPPLTHRAWNTITKVASSFTRSRPQSEHSRASPVAPKNSLFTELQTSETDVVNHENPGTLVKIITTLLDNVTPPMEENHYVDTSNQTDSEDEGSKKGEKEAKACHAVGEGVRIDGTGAVLVERDAQTEQSGGQTQVIGVSCPGQVTEGDAHGQAGDAMQPLVLSVGSSFPPQESIHSTDVEVPSDPAAVAAAQALSIGQTTVGVDRVGNDIEMTNVQAASSKPTSTSTHWDDQASAQLQVGVPDSDIQAQGTAQAPVAIDRDKENERPTQDNATAAPVATDDNVQFFSLSRAEEQNGTFAEARVRRESRTDRSMSEMPLVEALASVERNTHAETASALGAMIRSGSNIFGGHSLRSRSPTPSGLLYSAYTPSDQRLHQLLDYLLNLVQNDKMQGNLLCKRLLAMREEFAQEFEQAKKQFEARLANNNEAMYNARISQNLKKDTMRLLKTRWLYLVCFASYSIKVNDLNDLLRPMPIRHKHSGSQVGSIRGVAHAGTPAAAQAGVSGWLSNLSCSRAGTPASTSPRSVIDSVHMPTPPACPSHLAPSRPHPSSLTVRPPSVNAHPLLAPAAPSEGIAPRVPVQSLAALATPPRSDAFELLKWWWTLYGRTRLYCVLDVGEETCRPPRRMHRSPRRRLPDGEPDEGLSSCEDSSAVPSDVPVIPSEDVGHSVDFLMRVDTPPSRATWEPKNVAPVAGNKVHEVIDDSDDVDDDDTLFLRSRT